MKVALHLVSRSLLLVLAFLTTACLGHRDTSLTEGDPNDNLDVRENRPAAQSEIDALNLKRHDQENQARERFHDNSALKPFMDSE